MNELVEYTCHKTVKARPMKRRDYCAYRGWSLPKDENPDDDGFLVVYADGYESWSPDKQFYEGYAKTEDALDRLMLEKQQLHEKWEKLNATLENPDVVSKISMKQVRLLIRQRSHMEMYLLVLNERLEEWGVK